MIYLKSVSSAPGVAAVAKAGPGSGHLAMAMDDDFIWILFTRFY